MTQFYQGLAAGEGDLGYEYGGKADLLVTADLSKLGFWDGLSMTLHGEYNFGNSVNGRGGVLIPVNSALNFPGIEGADAYDLSSLYFVQEFGDSNTVVFGKINMIDIVSGRRPFLGGAGIDAFWNLTFVAPPTGTVPAYLLGALLSVRTEQATYRLWVYDPASYVNKLSLADAFEDGVTIRGSIQVPVTIAGRRGNQGFTALYSTQDGTDLSNLDEILVPTPEPGTVATKNSRYYFAWSFDQYLYQPAASPDEGVGLFGQVGISDGNPNALHWSFLVGLGGTGLVPGRSGDNWGIGYYYDSLSDYLKDALAPTVRLRDEQGLEIFYNLAVTPWFRPRRRPPGHPARTVERHRGLAGPAGGDQVLSNAGVVRIRAVVPANWNHQEQQMSGVRTTVRSNPFVVIPRCLIVAAVVAAGPVAAAAAAGGTPAVPATSSATTAQVPADKQTVLGLYVTARDAYAQWKAAPDKVTILDVRTIEEYMWVGHTSMAWLVPVVDRGLHLGRREEAVPAAAAPGFCRPGAEGGETR